MTRYGRCSNTIKCKNGFERWNKIEKPPNILPNLSSICSNEWTNTNGITRLASIRSAHLVGPVPWLGKSDFVACFLVSANSHRVLYCRVLYCTRIELLPNLKPMHLPYHHKCVRVWFVPNSDRIGAHRVSPLTRAALSLPSLDRRNESIYK